MITVLVGALLLQPQSAPPDIFGEKAVEEVGGFEMLAPVLQCAGRGLQAHVVTDEQRGNFEAAVTFLRKQLDSCGSREVTQRISSALIQRDKTLEKEAADNTATSYVLMTELHLMEPALQHFDATPPSGTLPFLDKSGSRQDPHKK